MAVEQEPESHLGVADERCVDDGHEVLHQQVRLGEGVPAPGFQSSDGEKRAAKLEFVLVLGSFKQRVQTGVKILHCELNVVDSHAVLDHEFEVCPANECQQGDRLDQYPGHVRAV
jgi:hypothetical protein